MNQRKTAAAVAAMTCAWGGAAAVDVLPNVPAGGLVARLEVAATGISGEVGGTLQFFPTDVAELPDGRLLVMTLGGVIRVVDPASGLRPEPYLDVTSERTLIATGNFGMTSLVVHPGFADADSPGHGKFYVLETEEKGDIPADFDGSITQVAFGGQHHDVIVEYTAADPAADVFSGTRREVIRVEQPGWDHNVFDMAFGVGDESGLLYITSGDGANVSQGMSGIRQNPQALSNVFGKILRIDPLGTDGVNGQYGVPPDNPFVGQVGVRPEIWSYGHRAPYRISVDRNTGEVWVGEVGQRNIEEINRVERGGNHGWPLKEGSFLFNEFLFDDLAPDADLDGNGTGDFADAQGLTDPVFEYDHGSGVAVIGGSVYRGDRWPLLVGSYVFGDLVRGGALQSGFYFGNAAAAPSSNALGPIAEFGLDPAGSALPASLFSIGEGLDGTIYLIGSLGGTGVVLRLVNACPADIAQPAGILDLADVGAFVSAFTTQDPTADLTEPFGVLDLADLSAFIASFTAGCP